MVLKLLILSIRRESRSKINRGGEVVVGDKRVDLTYVELCESVRNCPI